MPSKEFLKYLDKERRERLRIRLLIEKGSVKKLVVQYETFLQDKWIVIVRYDTAHGFFHRDILYPNGEKEKQAIDMDNLNDAILFAEQDLKDRWEFYKNKYIKRMKL